MRPESVVLDPPFFNQDLSLLQGVEDFAVEQLIPELSVEALNIAVFPGAPRFNEECADIKPFEPKADNLGRKLGPVIRADIFRRTMLDEEPSKAIQDIVRL
jgi:hypothetical protein